MDTNLTSSEEDAVIRVVTEFLRRHDVRRRWRWSRWWWPRCGYTFPQHPACACDRARGHRGTHTAAYILVPRRPPRP